MTRQQTWAAAAHKCILGAKDSNNAKKYNTFARKMPSLIQTSGLIQALVFIESRSNIGEQFCDDMATIYGIKDRQALRAKVQKAGLERYLALSRDMISVSIWMRRFAQIELGDEVDEQ